MDVGDAVSLKDIKIPISGTISEYLYMKLEGIEISDLV